MPYERVLGMVDEIQRSKYEDYRLMVQANEQALERTVPRYMAAAFGKKGTHIPTPPPLPTYEEVLSGKISGKFDGASDQDTFVSHEWWNPKFKHLNPTPEHRVNDKTEVSYAGTVRYVPDADEEGYERIDKALEGHDV